MNEKKYYEYIKKLENVKELHIMKEHFHHGTTTTYEHCKKVAYFSFIFAKKFNLKIDYKNLVRAALLHDFFLYDWHEKKDGHDLHAFSHPQTAYKNASKYFNLNSKEKNIIESHMWPLTLTKIPKSKEAFIVCFVDKYCALMETIKFENKVVFSNEDV